MPRRSVSGPLAFRPCTPTGVPPRPWRRDRNAPGTLAVEHQRGLFVEHSRALPRRSRRADLEPPDCIFLFYSAGNEGHDWLSEAGGSTPVAGAAAARRGPPASSTGEWRTPRAPSPTSRPSRRPEQAISGSAPTTSRNGTSAGSCSGRSRTGAAHALQHHTESHQSLAE